VCCEDKVYLGFTTLGVQELGPRQDVGPADPHQFQGVLVGFPAGSPRSIVID
jgi:hypothetical protein